MSADSIADPPREADAVVVGAGLAGLAAALHLQRAGHDVVVLEASGGAGGRIRTDVIDGFRLDRGFQLYNPAYPEGLRMFDHQRLDLRGFERGALVSTGDGIIRLGDPRSHPTWAVDALRGDLGGPVGLLRFALYAARCATARPADLATRPDVSIRAALTSAGVPQRLLDRVVTPFLSGVFLEPDLSTSRLFADLILRSFVRGTPAVPALGMQALPDQLASGIHNLHLNTKVRGLTPGGVDTDAGRINARAVIIAVGPTEVAALLPGFTTPRTHACTTWYHVPDQPAGEIADGLAILTLDGDGHGPVVNSAVMSHAAPTYSPPGYSLIASTSVGLGHGTDEAAVRAQLGRMYRLDTRRWSALATYDIPAALPAMDVPLTLRQDVRLGAGRYLAGDHRDTASIQGALVSGRRAAQAAQADVLRA